MRSYRGLICHAGPNSRDSDTNLQDWPVSCSRCCIGSTAGDVDRHSLQFDGLFVYWEYYIVSGKRNMSESVDPESTAEAPSLAGRTLVTGVLGGVCLAVICVATLAGKPGAEWTRAAIGLCVAAAVGFFFRGLRRKAWFGSALTLHQSISFEVIVQTVHWLSPSLGARAFETEFLMRETGMDRGDATAWIASRRLALPVVASGAAAAIWWLTGHTGPAVVFGLCAIASALIGLARLGPAPRDAGSTRSFIAGTLAGLGIWAVEGWLFVMATGGMFEAHQALLLYLGFTAAAELAVVPMAIGVAQLPALLAIGWGVGPAALGVLMIFHAARLALLALLGLVYLPRYKLTVDDLLDAGLISRLVLSQRPTDGWIFEDDENVVCDVSVIIPAYNEQERLPPYLDAMVRTLTQSQWRWEVIVVDDGSADRTAEIVLQLADAEPRVRLVRNSTNLGKGGAVANGVSKASGRYVIFADADGATPSYEVSKLVTALGSGAEIAIGSRNRVSKSSTLHRDSIRAALGSGFYALVNFLAVPGIRDTQCGFKGFRRDAALRVFDGLTETGWAFDVELLYRAQLVGYAVTEVPVDWQEIEGSKLSPFRDAIRMAVAIFHIRRRNAGFIRRGPASSASANGLRFAGDGVAAP